MAHATAAAELRTFTGCSTFSQSYNCQAKVGEGTFGYMKMMKQS
jgi:hypothetical protein